MSTITRPGVDRTIDACRRADATPVRIDAESLDSTAPDHLRELKRELGERDLVPAELAARVRFDRESSLAVQAAADRVREYVRAASFLGAARVTVGVDAVADEKAVESALRACAERAHREGVVLELEGPVSLG